MPLPASFARDGFVSPAMSRTRMKLKNGRFLKPVMIGTEGASDTGKTEFILSCPGPGLVIPVDRGYDPVLDNPHPPAARRDDFGFKAVNIPLQFTATQEMMVQYFKDCRDLLYKALANLDALTVAIDGDSDFWELQVLAEFGKKTQIWPQTRWGDVYAKKRAITTRCHDSGKIIIATNKLKEEYEEVLGEDGLPVIDEATKEAKRVKTGRYERQGFKDQTYLWNIQIRHLYEPAKTITKTNPILKREVTVHTPSKYGIRILKCKPNPDLVGIELWGDQCNFAGLVQTVYPRVPMEEWGL